MLFSWMKKSGSHAFTSMFSQGEPSLLNFNVFYHGGLYGVEPDQLSRTTGASAQFIARSPLWHCNATFSGDTINLLCVSGSEMTINIDPKCKTLPTVWLGMGYV